MAGPEDLLHPDFPRREVEVDVDEGGGTAGGARGASITWIVLGVGLALTLLLAKLGIWFLFLPIIIPFGFGGRSLAGRLSGSLRRRVVRLEHGTLSLDTRSPAGASREASIDVSGGAFVSIAQLGLRDDGRFEATVRFVGASGAFETLLPDVSRARALKQRVSGMLTDAGVRIVDRSTSLQGGISVRRLPRGEELEWEARRTRSWGARRRTLLALGAEEWKLEIRSGSRLESSTGGPGIPEPRLSTEERTSFVESGAVEIEQRLDLVWDGDVVARIGGDLSEPELHYVVSRILAAQPGR